MDKKFTIFVIALSVALLGIFVFIASGSKPAENIVSSSTYSENSADKPSAQVKNTSFNLGDMKVSDEKSTDFVIKNTGNRPLQITGVSTSCHCTAGKVIYEGTESEEYGMHAPGATVISEIAPSKEAIVRVTYRPFLMPVYGFIEREAYVETNDPKNQKIILRVTANVK